MLPAHRDFWPAPHDSSSLDFERLPEASKGKPSLLGHRLGLAHRQDGRAQRIGLCAVVDLIRIEVLFSWFVRRSWTTAQRWP